MEEQTAQEEIAKQKEFNQNPKDGEYSTEPAKEPTAFTRFEGYLIVALIIAIVITLILSV